MRLGDYTLIKQLGDGSLGSVFLAEHQFLKRSFAIKVLSEELSSDPEFISCFEKRAAEVALLDHPHLVKVHNVSYADGHYFLVVDHGAEDLVSYLARQKAPLPEEKVRLIGTQIASALDYMHKKALFHSAIKLTNVFVKEEGDLLNVQLADGGLSSISEKGKTFPQISDKEGYLSFLHHYHFLSPEVKRLEKENEASDTYAFGVLIYYLLFQAFPEGYFELPSKKTSSLLWNWDELIASCLHCNPSKRPASLQSSLDEILEHKEAPRPILKPQQLIRPEFEPDPAAVFQIDTTIGRYQPKEEGFKEILPLLTEMAIIPGGTFMRGSNQGGRDEMPRHAIPLSSFAIDVHPVTNEQFVRFLEAMGGEKDVNNSDIIRLRESRIRRSGGTLNIESGYAKHPVVGVTWYGATAYAKWVGKRLPTEAEWEVGACGGKEENIYPSGENIERSEANFFSSDTTAVMSYPPTSYGLYDMAGNVYEWCSDWYDYHYYNVSAQEPNNPKGPHQGVYRVLRGGCWKSLKEDLRCAHRHRNNPGAMNGTCGFRCAADVV